MINGSKAGTVSIDKVDRDIVIKYDVFDKNVSPESLSNLKINTRI
jgi:hypothetical protein